MSSQICPNFWLYVEQDISNTLQRCMVTRFSVLQLTLAYLCILTIPDINWTVYSHKNPICIQFFWGRYGKRVHIRHNQRWH